MKILRSLSVLSVLFVSTYTEAAQKDNIENRTIPADFIQKSIKEDFFSNSYGKVHYISKLSTLTLENSYISFELSKSIGSSYTYAIDIDMTVYQDHFFNWEQELYPISHDIIYITGSLWKRFILLNYLLYHH